MALAVDAISSSGEVTGNNSLTFEHTVSGSNRLLIVGVHIRDGSTADYPVTGITYNGVALTKIRHDEFFDTAGGRSEIWYLIAPDTGAHDIVVSFTGTLDQLAAFGISFTGADQTSPINAHNGGAAKLSGTAVSTVSVTTTADNCYLVDAIYEFDSPPVTEGASQTIIHSLSPNNNGDVSAGSYKSVAGAGSHSMSWTWTATTERYMHSVAAIKPAATDTVTPQTITGKSRITAVTTKTVTGKSRITANTLQTILGKARVTAPATKTILGKARITIVTPQTILGKARVTIATLKTILGKSRITSTITIIDSYSESNAVASNPYILDGNITAVGQSFTGKGTLLNHAVFYVKKVGSPTGNAVAKIYAHTGVFGSEGMPTGSPLATSDNFDVSTLTTSYGLISFNFTGANKILLANGINYVVTLEYSNGSGSNYLLAGMDNTSPSHSGNMSFKEIGNWGYDNYDLSFYVYGYTAGLLLGKSRISTSVSAIISAVSRIRVSAVKTALGKARVRAVNLTTFIGKSKITAIGAFRRNLCTNPSFETNNTGFWNGSTSRSNDYALYGSYSGKITTTFTNGTITGGHNYLNTINRFSAIAGRKYIFSAYVYVPVGSPITTISIGIRSWNTYAHRSVNGTKTLTPGQWVRVSVDWLCTSQEDLRFTVADPAAPGFTGSASLYVDGIAIEEIVPGNNLAPNSSFELDTDWSTNINFSYSTEQKYIGNRSMKFNSLTPTVNASITGYIGVKSSTLYLLSCMMYRVAGFSGAIYIDFFEYDKNFNLLNDATGVYFSGSNSIWVKKETIFTTNANTKYIKLRLVCDSSALGTAYFDDVFLYSLDYFDGSISPATWLGVAHESISILLVSGILGLSRITIASLQTFLGKSRIMITVLKTVLGKARVRIQSLKTLLGKSRIRIVSKAYLGSALQFDGVQNYVSLGTMGNFGSQLGNGFYCKFDIKKSTSSAGNIIGLTNNGGRLVIALNADNNYSYLLNQIDIRITDNNNLQLDGYFTTPFNFNDNIKHTFEITVIPSTNIITCIVDGISKPISYRSRQSPSVFTNFNIPLFLGSMNIHGTPGRFLNVILDNFEIGTSPSDLRGKYTINEGSGLTIADSSGKNNHGSLMNDSGTYPQWVGGLNEMIGKSRITIATLKIISGISRVRQLSLQSILGKSRMTAVTMEYIAGKAKITTIIQSVLTGIGRVQKAIIKTISGKGSINALTSKELTGKARIISPGRYIRQVSQSTSQGKLYNPAGQDFYTQL